MRRLSFRHDDGRIIPAGRCGCRAIEFDSARALRSFKIRSYQHNGGPSSSGLGRQTLNDGNLAEPATLCSCIDIQPSLNAVEEEPPGKRKARQHLIQ